MITQERLQEALTVEKVIAWLETKPADVSFDYTEPKDCLISRYVRETLGLEKEQVSCNPDRVTVRLYAEVPYELDRRVVMTDSRDGARRYGDVLQALKNVDRASS